MAATSTHALDLLDKPPAKIPPVCVAAGDEHLLRRQVSQWLRDAVTGGDEFSMTTFDGDEAELRDVIDELSTMAMFGGGRRLAVVDNADDFVTQNRAALEDYVAKPRSSGVLLLNVKTWPANTRLAKAVAASGLTIDCSTPTEAKLSKWAQRWAKKQYQAELDSSAANVLIEIVGPEMGLLDQELSKLAGAVEPGRKIVADDVHRLVGSWRTKSTWDMLDAALLGQSASALEQLDRLLRSGEEPVAILGQIASSLRKLATAARHVFRSETEGRRMSLRGALEAAGVRMFIEKAETQLKRLGRYRSQQLYRWLLDTDIALKSQGGGRPAARRTLERLIARISAAAEPQVQSR
ncbi:MAG: DNA polymerase III subunit delta [Planctomycetes bacterium]|nr:DNA polymerase III subunit delta [Planctomycetota bacterium]